MNAWLLLASIVVWAGCSGVWFVLGERRFSSPLFLYLIFHFVCFVVRPLLLYWGADQGFFRDFVRLVPTKADHDRAIWATMVGLCAFTLGSLFGEALARGKQTVGRGHFVDAGVSWFVGSLLLGLSAVSIVLYGNLITQRGAESERVQVGGATTSISDSSAYVTNFYVVIVGVLLVWITTNGVKGRYLFLLGAYFLVVIVGGENRTLYLVGGYAVALAIMAVQGRRWPSKRIGAVIAVAVLSFTAGKSWLREILGLEDPTRYSISPTTRFRQLLEGQNEVLINYDQLATVTTVIPRYADYSDVTNYLRPFYFWVPRAIWSGKPLFDYPAAYIQTNVPQIRFNGLIVTLVGESYMAFGFPSVVLLMAVWGMLVNYGHGWSLRYPVGSVERLFGIASSAAMVQVYRDGIGAYNAYMLYYFGPCLVIALASAVLGPAATEPGGAHPSPLHNRRRTAPATARGLHARRLHLAARQRGPTG